VKLITNIANLFQVAKSVHAAGSAFVSVTMFYENDRLKSQSLFS